MTEKYVADFYCGLGGWAEGFLAEGVKVIGFDIERHDYGTGGYPGQLVIQDVRTLHGSQFRNALGLVASPPCQKYSYMAMPWKRAKALAAWYRKSPERIAELNELFNACFRIQREASEAAGRHIPLIVENVCGAQPWVGRAQAHFGSFYLWGDVGMVGNRVVVLNGPLRDAGLRPRSRALKGPGGDWFKDGRQGQDACVEAIKIVGQDWSRFKETGEVSPHWRMEASKNDGGSWFNVAHNTESGIGQNPDGRKRIPHRTSGHWPNPAEHVRIEDAGIKLQSPGHYRKPGSGPDWYDGGAAAFGSNSAKRKAASAQIAKIPFPLARYIARSFTAAGGGGGNERP